MKIALVVTVPRQGFTSVPKKLVIRRTESRYSAAWSQNSATAVAAILALGIRTWAKCILGNR
jgi:hypothetical protein